MNVQLVQSDIVWEDREANLKHVEGLLEAAKPVPGGLIILPEMFATGFSMNIAATAQEQGRAEEVFLRDIAEKYRCLVLGGVVSALGIDQARNEAVVFGPEGALACRYAKMRPFTFGGEPAAGYVAGTEVVTFSWQGFTVAPFICYDLRFPELFREAVKLGANLFVVIASWPVKRHQHWLTLLQARAIENQAFVIGVNRTGTDPHSHYNGRSVVVDPQGHIIADAGERERVLSAEVALEEVTRWRRDFPALQDMH